MLDDENKNQTDYTIATFKATKLINGQTIEIVGKNQLNFWISHRFGAIWKEGITSDRAAGFDGCVFTFKCNERSNQIICFTKIY